MRLPTRSASRHTRSQALAGLAGFVICTLVTSCGSAPPARPSAVGARAHGTVVLATLQLAAVSFHVDRDATLTGTVDWSLRDNDVDISLLRGRCAAAQVVAQAVGCGESAVIETDDRPLRPLPTTWSVKAGDYTLVIFNWGPGTEAVSYDVGGPLSAIGDATVGTVVLGPERRTETFPFTLAAGTTASTILGPLRVGPGPVDVSLAYAGTYTVVACVGPPGGSCIPFGGRPQSRSFSVPGDFPVGLLQASVYFNPNQVQPAGNASGTITFTYSPP